MFPRWEVSGGGFTGIRPEMSPIGDTDSLPPRYFGGISLIERDQSMPTQQQIREDITAKIIESLEQGVKPWRRPWSISPNSGRPTNFLSHKLYQGINPPLLELHSLRFNLRSKWWATYRQWADLGCLGQETAQRRGAGPLGSEHHPLPALHEDRSRTTRVTRKSTSSCSCGTFVVFNAEQVEGRNRREAPSPRRTDQWRRPSRLCSCRRTDRRKRC